MKKVKLVLSILFFFSIIIFCGCFGIPILGFNMPITIVNNTGFDIVIAAMLPDNSSDISDVHYFINVGESSLRNGDNKNFSIPRLKALTRYTLMMFDINDIVYIKNNVTITNGMVLTFTQSDLSSYQPSQETTSNTTVQSAPSVPAIYRVGDTGPAGGLIFYDKGNNSGGWRYLEAAPYEAEFLAPWSVRLRGVLNMVGNTQDNIGSGRQNTRLIAELLSQTGGEWDSAVIKINELEINGFSDWFLPSLGELDLMYGNLKRRNLGDFMDGWYWSSTEYRQGADLGWGVSAQNFSNGQVGVAVIGIFGDERANSNFVRPIRQVAHP